MGMEVDQARLAAPNYDLGWGCFYEEGRFGTTAEEAVW